MFTTERNKLLYEKQIVIYVGLENHIVSFRVEKSVKIDAILLQVLYTSLDSIHLRK